MRREFAVVLAVFVATSIITLMLPIEVREFAIKSIEDLTNSFELFVNGTGVWGILVVPLIIFYNNLRVALLNILLGFIIIPPLAIVAMNSYIITSFIIQGDVVSNLILILPHGIIELFAILFSAAIGLKLGITFIKKRSEVLNVLKEGLRRLFLIMLLLLVASLIETFVTPLVYFMFKALSGEFSFETGLSYG
ncbi:MAG: hypothetical protein DRO18_02890 [Thermoprotei archaeon]|nr:MAG: hypothetical protein DRO18_02890 [Thermoprotei archaeon]